ncbi:hypothetical protein GpartN1_g188.t1 [Galdieria partita]|uniref:Fatty acid desaturase domain-containing protein n=1 Tax=Galdieria partita TaxID=83374 RepID=A0A9C7PRG7_9RHOD|nr:hypothetical protein GpartN1_g188.t1 [Galdieria partita]
MARTGLNEEFPKIEEKLNYTDKDKYLTFRELLRSSSFVFFFVVHLIALAVFFVRFRWSFLLLALVSYCVRMLAITAGYHRYFSHRSFRTGRLFQFFLACLGCSACQKGVLWWASWHRHHHRYADTEQDVHSPYYGGFWWSHLGWFLFSDKHVAIQWHLIPDLVVYKELLWLEEHHYLPGTILALISYLMGGFGGFVWIFCLSTVILWHATFTVNSLCHLYGYQNFLCEYHESCNAKNNILLAILTLGEGWHNNHHSFMGSSRQGLEWWEIDFCYYFIRIMSILGLVDSFRVPSCEQIEARKLRSKSTSGTLYTVG